MTPVRPDLPTGTVTFLFTDIEGSTQLAQELDAPTFRTVLEQHHRLMRAAFAAHGGIERGTEGDSFVVIFTEAGAATHAAIAAQRGLTAANWPAGVALRVRMGLHSGLGIHGGDDYIGIDINRAARIAAAAHGGQILLSDATRALVENALPGAVTIRDLGSHRLRDLVHPERLFQLVVDDLPSTFPALRTASRATGNLPLRLTSFVGREVERAEVASLIGAGRLVTITGPGGTGKTSLALAVAGDVADHFADGAWFVPLDAVTDPALVPAAVVRGLRLEFQDRRTPTERVVDFLRDRAALLVLDNFEHLPGAVAFVGHVLEEAPATRMIVASQVALHVGGEQEFPLGPLAMPAPRPGNAGVDAEAAEASAAVRLFVERARAVRPEFRLDPANLPTVIELCARLDGLPLAIELAASQMRVLSPTAIMDRLSRRLEILASQRSDLPSRQRTLEGAVAWSYDLLSSPAKRLLRCLSVFAGGGGLAEIEALVVDLPDVPDALAALADLVDRSLVQRSTTHDDRFVLLETIRAYGAARLSDHGEDVAAVRLHAEVFAQLAERAEPELLGSSRRTWLERLAVDHDNLRTALARTEASGDIETALRISAAAWRFWQQGGHLAEAGPRLERLLDAAERSGRDLSPALLSRAEEAAGGIAYWTRAGDGRGVLDHYLRSLEYAQQVGDARRIAWAKYNLSFAYDYVPTATQQSIDRDRAAELRGEALEEFRELGDRRGEAYVLWATAGSPTAILEAADTLLDRLGEALALFREVDDPYGETWALLSSSMVHRIKGELDVAREEIGQAAALFIRDGDLAGQIVVIEAIASLAAAGGDPALATRLDAAGVAARRATGALVPAIPPLREGIDSARATLDRATIAREEAAGAELTLEQVLAYAVDSAGPARAILDVGTAAVERSRPPAAPEISRRRVSGSRPRSSRG